MQPSDGRITEQQCPAPAVFPLCGMRPVSCGRTVTYGSPVFVDSLGGMPNLTPWAVVVAVAILSALAVSLARLLIKWLLLRHASERISRLIGKALRPAQLMAAT